MNGVRPRNGGEVVIEASDGLCRLTVADLTDDEVATVYLTRGEAERVAELVSAFLNGGAV